MLRSLLAEVRGSTATPLPFHGSAFSALAVIPGDSVTKLLRYGQVGAERPGLIDVAGRIHDLSGVVPDICGVRIASAKILPGRAVASPEMLRAARRGGMSPGGAAGSISPGASS